MSAEIAEQVRERGLPTIVVNNTFRLAHWADMLYAADIQWWEATPDAANFAGLKVTIQPVPGVLNLQNAGTIGYTDDLACLHTYGNSGSQAIQIAAKAGARSIELYGFDMQGSHWHGEHEKPLRNTKPELYVRWLERMPALAEALKSRGISVINCTPGSALRCFPFERRA